MRRLSILLFALAISVTTDAAQPMRLGQAEFYWLMDRACVSGDDISVAMLLKAGAEPSGTQGYGAFLKKYNKPFEPSWHLIQASRGGHAAVVRLLLDAGADPNLVEGEGVTALTEAAALGHLDVVRLLLATAVDTNYRTHEGTAIELATRNGHIEIAEAIRDKR